MATTLSHLIVKLDADIEGLKRGANAADRAMVNLGKKMQRTGGVMSAALTLPLTAIGVAATKMASDAEEAANKFEVVMGDSAARVNARLAELHDTIPLTTAQMQGLAAGVQDLLVPMGVVRDEAADMSATMVELAGDLGSFNNVAPDQVLEAMKSALAGSSEPMRRFGVDTREAALKAIALEHGLIRAGGAMTSTARAQAVLLAIQQDSTDAIGDAARTADSAANSFKFLKRDMGELAITIGDILLPVVTPMVQSLTKAVGALNDMSPVAKRVTIAIAALAAAAGPLLVVLGTMLTLWPAIAGAMTAVLGPAALALAAFGALAGAAYVLIKNWDVMKVWMAQLWRAIQATVFDGVDSVIGAMELLASRIPWLGDKVTGLRESFNEFAAGALAKTDEAIGRFQRQISDNVTPAVEAATVSADGFSKSLEEGVTRTAKEASEALRALQKEIDYFVDRRAKVELVGNFQAPIAKSVEFLDIGTQRIDAEFAKVTTIAERFGLSLRDVIKHVEDPALRSALQDRLPAGPAGIFEQVGDAFKAMLPALGPMAVVMPLVSGALEALRPLIEAVKEPLRRMGQIVATLIAPALQLLAPILRAVVTLFSYLMEGLGWLIEGIGRIITKIPGLGDFGLIALGEQMQENARAARNFEEATNDAADALRANLVNAVRGFKVSQYTHGATDVGGSDTPKDKGPGARGGGVEIGDIFVQGGYRELYEELDQRTRGSGEAARAWFRSFPEPAY